MKDRGFTLMEMIVTIVVGSFIILGIAGYVQLGMKGYADTIDRQRIQTQAQFVLEKMTREIRHAVPNSFHEPAGTSNCLEFVPIEYSGFYVFTANDIEFLVGNDPDLESIPEKNRMVINPSRYEDLQSSSQSIDISGLTKTKEAFVVSGAASSIGATSVSGRHYIYQPSTEVRYCFDNGRVLRNNVIVTDSIDASASYMRYVEPTLQRGGLVHINLEFLQDGERSVYQQDVQVLNVP
ncbi:prepilin-type N-terminal cleavage/methylation domain-containing protein [Vibrio alginolyticus]|uniref:PilW family protein n=1 Tax=Vibrio alginolyticus TaxID=663 RepID=UPI0028066DC4|nr:prepilin-type N-terminal cleavage/methylation domain-containing protein [Vibrio alginolyticus]EGR2354582.1 prepilin-type N-terminal cleavage/methylation domain-containing protein [Vibrio alginolyticus]EIL8373429.1 prepilin-type N-terminal cleavage/methylation domain-containing protein [Vibrio alginolyticus]ELA8263244.1 prepilin-type N-terminal cleavage/methylation domain-containing protein [Vibrio alginolyticus]ELB2926629.1 prepilin-type N-terminal cleavage/methylation domain-containing prot